MVERVDDAMHSLRLASTSRFILCALALLLPFPWGGVAVAICCGVALTVRPIQRGAGLALASVVCFAIGGLWSVALYHAETESGVARVSLRTHAQAGTLDQFVGQTVCLKGYGIPAGRPQIFGTDDQGPQYTHFILSADGGYQSREEMIGVVIENKGYWTWSDDALAVTGVLVRNAEATKANRWPMYLLLESRVRPSRTAFDIVPPGRRGC